MKRKRLVSKERPAKGDGLTSVGRAAMQARKESNARVRKNKGNKRSKTVLLTGDERYFIQHTIEKVKKTARTEMEHRLLRKVI